MKEGSNKRLASLACLLGLSLILYTIESQLPPPVPLPGVKLGLANIITLVTMALFDRKSAFEVLILRILLGSIVTGSGIGLLYSMAGGVFCFAVMAVVFPAAREQLWAVSMLGAIAHHAGQLAAAAAVTWSWAVFPYLPILTAAGMITGCFTGLCAMFCLKRWNQRLEK